MAKPRKPSTARKPPVPSDSHADIEDWIRRVMPDLHPRVALRSGKPHKAAGVAGLASKLVQLQSSKSKTAFGRKRGDAVKCLARCNRCGRI
jgi:hypothetical protein